MINWLVKRLSPVKADEPRWIQFAESIQELWAEGFDPGYEALRGCLSVYTTTAEDLAKKVRELGDYFRPDYPTEYDQPLALAWKKAEIKRKDTEFILKSVFRRNFADLTIEWIPLYAHRSKEYGTSFVVESDLKEWEKETLYFQTSRGKIKTDLGHLHSIGLTKDSFLTIAEPLVAQYKPEHIVYDGPLFYLTLPIDVKRIPLSLTGKSKRSHIMTVDFSLRFDSTAADETFLDKRLDFPTTYKNGFSSSLFFVPDTYLTHLDPFVCSDGIPCDWMPLDTMHSFDKEGDLFPTIDLPFARKIKTLAPAVWGE